MDTVIAVGKVNISGLLSGELFPACEVVSTESIRAVQARNSVVVLGEGAVISERIDALAVVIDADAEMIPESLCGNAVITCGIGSRNTVSVTSKTADMITLSLNRAVHTLKGLCEPMELPVPLHEEHSDFDYMAAFAASVLSGKV